MLLHFLAAAMQETNLHKRLALLVLSIVGNKTRNIVIGAILVSILLAFLYHLQLHVQVRLCQFY